MAPCCRFGSTRKRRRGLASLPQISRDLEDKRVNNRRASGILLFTNNLPRVVFGSFLGVDYIFCESGTVLVNEAAADKIWRVLPDATDRDEPMPVLIQKYDVEIVSKIGKEALLKFTLGRNERWSENIFVPTEGIAGYRQAP